MEYFCAICIYCFLMSRKSIASRLIGHCMYTGQVCLCVTCVTWCRCCSWCRCIITTFRDCCETSRNEISVRLRRALNAISHYGHNLQCVCYFMTRNCMQHVPLMWATHTCAHVCYRACGTQTYVAQGLRILLVLTSTLRPLVMGKTFIAGFSLGV